MCEYVTASLAIASIAAGYAAQRQQVQRQSKYQNEMYSKNAESALNNYYAAQKQLGIRAQQDEISTSEEAALARSVALTDRSTAEVMAGESGVTGNSIQSLFSSYDAIDAANQMKISRNQKWRIAQANEDAKSARAQTQSAISSATPQPLSLPSLLQAGLQIGAVGAGSYERYQERKRQESIAGMRS
jgi:hypothetical protein